MDWCLSISAWLWEWGLSATYWISNVDSSTLKKALYSYLYWIWLDSRSGNRLFSVHSSLHVDNQARCALGFLSDMHSIAYSTIPAQFRSSNFTTVLQTVLYCRSDEGCPPFTAIAFRLLLSIVNAWMNSMPTDVIVAFWIIFSWFLVAFVSISLSLGLMARQDLVVCMIFAKNSRAYSKQPKESQLSVA